MPPLRHLSLLILSDATAPSLLIPTLIHKAFPLQEDPKLDLFSISSGVEVAIEATSSQRKQGGCCTDPLLFDTDNYSLGRWVGGWGGVSAGQEKSIPKISFHSLRRGCVGAAAVEKRVISTTAGEQKAA